MTKPKRRKTGGRQKMPPDKKRVPIAARVTPQTETTLKTNAANAKLSLGLYLDKVAEGLKKEENES